MKILLCNLIMMLSLNGFSQSDSLQRKIDEQVWKPFIQAFNHFDTKSFMAVHSKDMTRVIQDGNMIYGYERYYAENERDNESGRKSNRKRTIELRFIQRIASSDQAFEVGFYKYTGIQPDGSVHHGYGKFHVLLRREGTTWKILMDADASEKTNEAIFLSGRPIQ